ncbi:hypothetical protein BKA62DRAFT_816597 [Auriculariales sp. MPI-PUGE-AT-0066]|nr:hypothetical protein BKA62DRAFT_816597 [Auriculariales sp. MPI-PUGE-AT-0066]
MSLWYQRKSGATAEPDIFDSTHRFETSTILSPVTLGYIRLLIAAYGAATIIASALPSVRQPDWPTNAQSFSYLSNITWWGITGYHVVASFHTLYYARTGHAPLERWHWTLQRAHEFLWTTIVTLPCMVTIVFWSIQYSPEKIATPADAWSNITKHALNSAFAVFEIVFSRVAQPPRIHGLLIAIILGGYAGIAFITLATQGFMTYEFLDPSKHSHGIMAGTIIGMGALGVALFGAVSTMVWARLWVTERYLRWRPNRYGNKNEKLELGATL